jgi:hypothetical protein
MPDNLVEEEAEPQNDEEDLIEESNPKHDDEVRDMFLQTENSSPE